MKIALAALLVLHGIAHLVGFLVPWGILKSEVEPYSTTILAGSVDLGPVGIRGMGICWLLLAVSFGIAAWSLGSGQPWAVSWLVTSTLASLVASVLGWPDSRIGVLINVALLLVIWLAPHVGLLAFLTTET